MNKIISSICKLLFIKALMIASISSLYSQSQVRTINGKVTDVNKEPLMGVSILEIGTSNGTTTNTLGEFTIVVQSTAPVLRFTYVGFDEQRINVATKNILNVIMEETTRELDQVVVVGYGTMQKRDVTGSIVSVKSEEIMRKTPINVFGALQGQSAGVQIVSGSGAPGESSSIQIRGTSTFSAAGVEPLFIVDEMPVESIDNINPNDILSIEILKDAASTSIYGSRSANGVIIITTKQGERTKPKVELRYNSGIGRLAHKMPQTNRAERWLYDELRKQYFVNEDMSNTLITETDFIRNDSLNINHNVDNDYQAMVYKTSLKNELTATVSGGENKLRYFVSNGFLSERGIIPTTSFQRITARANFDYNASSRFRTGTRLSLSFANRDKVNEAALQSNIQRRAPYLSTLFPDKSIVTNTGYTNPIAYVEMVKNMEEVFTANYFQYYEFNLHRYLRLRTNFSGNLYLTRQKIFTPSTITDIYQKENSASAYSYFRYNWLNENYLTFDRKWEKHKLNAVLGISYQKWRYERDALVGRNSSNDYIYTMNSFVANLDLINTSATETNNALASLYSRLSYDYLGRYLFAANFRLDGSSRFAPENKWGSFPSFSVGWRFSDENFMKFSKNILDDAKIRFSYGVTGNQSIGDFDYYYTYSPGFVYDGIGGVSPARLESRNLRWEQITQQNIGLDLSFWKSRLNLTFDVYNKITDGILANFEVAKELGFSSVRRNIGTVSNKGIEFIASGDLIRTNTIRWNSSFNISVNSNKITKLSMGRPYIDAGMWLMKEGGKIGDLVGFKYIDIFQYNESNAFTPAWKQLTPVFSDGTFQYYELNGTVYSGDILQKTLPNGVPFRGGDVNWEENPENRNGIIDYDDRVLIGNALAEVTGGFNTDLKYKQWSLYLSFYYSFGNDIYNWAEYFRNSFKNRGATPTPQVINNLWIKQGDIALYPRPHDDEFENSRYANSFYIEDGSFIRLQDLRVSYDFASEIAKKLRLRNLNIYGYIQNVLTWTKYTGIDPEFTSYNPLRLGEDRGRYPRQRVFGLGLTLDF